MATFSISPPSLSLPSTKTHYFSSSSQTPTPPQPPIPTPQPQPLTATSDEQPLPPVTVKLEQEMPSKAATATTVESTDWIASTLTRRFGLGAGLAWAGFLAIGVLSEQIKTRLEVSQQEANIRDVEKQEELVLRNGIRKIFLTLWPFAYELRVGGGAIPRPGDLVVINVKGCVLGIGQEFIDTFGGDKRPFALVLGSRPYSKGICEGVEYVLRTMKAGGKRRVIVPPSLGFGENGADLGSSSQIPPFATVEHILELEKVSIAPA